MSRNVDYGEAIAILQINQKLKDDWQRRDPDADLHGTTSRLTVRNLEHAQALVDSCAKIWAEYEQENSLRGPKRGRKPGSGFKTILEDLTKVIEAKPEPKQYTSSDVAAELEERTQGNKEVREQKEKVKERRRRRPKGNMEVYKRENHQSFGDINLRVAIPVEYGEWAAGECAFTIRVGGQLVMAGEGDSRHDAWNDLCVNMAAKLAEIETRLDDGAENEDFSSEDSCWLWLHGMVHEEPVPDEYKEQWAAEKAAEKEAKDWVDAVSPIVRKIYEDELSDLA